MKNYPRHLLNSRWPILSMVIGIILLSGCSITRNLEDHETLLRRNTIRIQHDDEVQNFTKGELERFYQQKPNKRMLRAVPVHAAAHNYADRINISDSTGFSGVRKWFWKRKLNYKVWILKNGEPPVILDTAAADRTLYQMESFLFTRGHFSAQTDKVIAPPKRKRSVVTYNVYPGPGHIVRHIFTDIPTPGIRMLYESNLHNSLISEGMAYNERTFQDERERITRLLKENGYFHFDKAYIRLDVDTFVPGNELDIYLRILEQSFFAEENPDSMVVRSHLPSTIRNIYINPDFRGVFAHQELMRKEVQSATGRGGESKTYFIYSSGHQRFKPQMLIRNVFLEPGQKYDIRNVERTYVQLADLSNFSSISISFTTADTVYSSTDTIILIDCHINLMRMQRQFYEVNFDVINKAGDPGVTSYLVYQNRNLLRGAEVMRLSLKGALEIQRIAEEDAGEKSFFQVGTMEFGADLDIRIPRFVAPFNLAGLSKSFKPRTRFAGGFNFQERTDFKRYVFKLNSGYEWQYRQNVFMTVTPFEINSVSIFPDPEFRKKIEEFIDPRLRNAYSDHIITATRVVILFDNQGARSRWSNSYLRFTVESAGLLVNAFREPLGYPVNSEGFAMLFNIPYAQYLRSDLDYRHYLRLRQKDHMIAARIYLGWGNPYGNMNVLPFEKSFYVGGTNGVRAWKMRTIGPGSFGDQSASVRFDRSGDMAFESGIEYRFPLYGTIHGAVFTDAGNVWLKNKNPGFPGGEFRAENFFKELAVGSGVGVRIVTFFVIRVDVGVKLHDPARPEGERWVVREISPKKMNWNLGIGYSI